MLRPLVLERTILRAIQTHLPQVAVPPELEQQPQQFLDGLLLAAACIGAERCWIYLRDEYPAAHAVLTREIAFLVFADFQVLDATGPLAAFEIAARYRPGAYRLRVVAAEAGPVRASCGLCVSAEPLSAAGIIIVQIRSPLSLTCLLYTSDAADERSSVDLGGSRIIKQKKQQLIRTVIQTSNNKKKIT